jgi:hypothetical protein
VIAGVLSRGLWVGLAVVATVGFVGSIVKRERARGRIARVAQRRHLNYSPTDVLGLRRRLGHLRLFAVGYNRTLFDVVSGSTRQGPLYGFRYRYDRAFGSRRRSFQWTVVAMECPRVTDALRWVDPRLAEGMDDQGAAGPSSAVEFWREQCAALEFPAVVECGEHLLTVQVPDDGTDRQYDRLLDFVQNVCQPMPPASA